MHVGILIIIPKNLTQYSVQKTKPVYNLCDVYLERPIFNTEKTAILSIIIECCKWLIGPNKFDEIMSWEII